MPTACVWGESTQVACRGHLFCNQWALLSKLCCLLRSSIIPVLGIIGWTALASRARTKEFHIRNGI
jgi:hypothetical protein